MYVCVLTPQLHVCVLSTHTALGQKAETFDMNQPKSICYERNCGSRLVISFSDIKDADWDCPPLSLSTTTVCESV
jgi:hypothetical protein